METYEFKDENMSVRVEKALKKKIQKEAKKYGGTSRFIRMLCDEYFEKKQETK